MGEVGGGDAEKCAGDGGEEVCAGFGMGERGDGG